MRTILVALDATAAARPVLDTALALGRLTGAAVEAVHVRDGATEIPETLADRGGVPLRLLDGPVEPALLRALAVPDVIAAAMGARTVAGDQRPTGHTALRVLEQARKPLVVVPPGAFDNTAHRLRRLLVPLEGDAESSRAVMEGVLPLLADDVELVVLHVFTPDTAPRFLDRPTRDLELLSDEFLSCHCPPAAHVHLRTGSISGRVGELCTEEAADLIVLSWAQTMEAGHATVVREVLVHAEVPVLLVPVAVAWPEVLPPVLTPA